MLFYGIFIILFTINSTDSKGTFSVVPDNVAVIQGSAVRLNCSGDPTKPPRWFVHHNGKHGGKIFTGSDIAPEFRDYFSADTNVSGRYDLIINSTNKSHAGRYFCSENSDIAVSAEVIILDDQPSCNLSESSNITSSEELHTLWCNVSFRGNWPPTITWRSGGTSGSVITYNITQETIQNATVSSMLTISKNSYLYPTIITCSTTFDIMLKPNETDASNKPEFNSSCQLTIPPADGQSKRKTSNQNGQSEVSEPKTNNGIPVSMTILIVVLGFVIIVLLVVVARLAKSSAPIGHCCAERNKFPEPDIVTMDGSTPTNRSHREDDDSNADTPDVYYNVDQNNPRMAFTRQGEDGTEYVQVNFGSSNKPASAASSAKPKKKKTKQASKSDIYASIDHTVIEPEPEPPRQHRKKK